MSNKLRHIIFILLAIQSSIAFGQTYGNEWINYNQKYYSFKVYPETLPLYFSKGSETGIYKIDYNTLVNSSVPVETFATENIQIFGKEKEIPLYIEDGGDSKMDPGDFILFYTERNDGWLDSTLYEAPDGIGNPRYSLYNDTIEYYFTWNNSTNNLRYIEEDNIDFASYTPSNFILDDRWQSNTGHYQEGKRLDKSSSSFYTTGEGWSSGASDGGTSGYSWSGASIEIPHLYQGPDAPLVNFTGMQVGASNASSDIFNKNHHVQWTIGASDYVMIDSIWGGYTGIRMEHNFPVSVLPASGGVNLWIHILPDLGALTDYQAISHWSFKYPRIPTFDNENRFEFKVRNNPTESKIRLDISNIDYNYPVVFVHGDIPKKVQITPNGGNYTTLISNSTNGVDQHVIYQDTSTIKLVSTLTPVNENGTFTDFSSSPDLEEALIMLYNPKLDTASFEYAAYRRSSEGGGYTVLMANVNELYQQFGAGIHGHINGLRRFTHFIYNSATIKPVGLFILGKGIKEATIGNSPGTRRNNTYYNTSLIPSYGEPSCDVCITSNLEGIDKWTPLMGTGRISARNNTELLDYLDKVKLYEQNQDQSGVYDTPSKNWQKQVLHFSGGLNQSEQEDFKTYIDHLATVISDSLFGGNVTSVYKSTSDPLDPTLLDNVTDRISNGVSLMTYFGHASPTNSGFEINLDEPSNWNNYGKYPLMLVNSCYNGDIFNYSYSKSEQFVQTKDYGAIGYIASVNVGYDTYLNLYSKRFYDQLSPKGYGLTIGEQMKRTVESLDPSPASSSLYLETTCTQMVLNGDPMLRLNHHDNPEIELLESNVWFGPEDLDLTTDSIEVNIRLNNLGRSVTDSFSIEIIRNFPSSSIDSTYRFRIPNLHYQKEFSFKIPIQTNIGLGLNTFNISVDLPSEITEQYDEINNNQIVKTLFLDVDGILPISPYEFAVVPNDSVTVWASTINPISEFNTYRFEIDTIDFEGAPSQFHRYKVLSGNGGVYSVNPSEWTLSINPLQDGTFVAEDSVVYFWRVSIDGSNEWRESSFQYIENKEGWGQDHFFQFKKNSFGSIDYNRTTRTKDFEIESNIIDVDVKNNLSDAITAAYHINGLAQEYGLCTTTPTLHVAVIDPITHAPWGTRYGSNNPTHNFGNANDNGGTQCHQRVDNFFLFRQTDPAQVAAFENFINNEIPDGHYILIYSHITTRYDWWSSNTPSIFTTFGNLGSDSIISGRPNLPFAFFCKKGDPSTVVEYCSQDNTDDFTLYGTLLTGGNIGLESSPLIGPTTKWHNVYWKQDPLEASTADTTILTINAYNGDKNWQTSISYEFSNNDSILNLNNLLDASSFPYISLSARYKDTVAETPAQIDRWHVLYEPVPEAAIDGSNGYTWIASSDSISEGETIQFAIDVKNIFSVDMDSLLINYWVEDQYNVRHNVDYLRQDSLRVGETLRDTVEIPTNGLVGLNSLWMEVNPYINGSTYITDQPEQEHFNNILQVPFSVVEDRINPILDVTFNGNHILNGDIVDPNSEILISLKDENIFLIMDNDADTASFGVYLTDPNGTVKRIPFVDGNGNSVMQWIPANSQNRRFKIIWPAGFEIDGKYKLLVQGTDKTGNLSGNLEYRVTFEVSHESSITNMMNYPNPFSTSTRFVFTLTGSEKPDDIIIQIMNVSGRVVREITEDELGPIQIGRNITEFAWDGTDEFGDPLANGVYLYKVKAKINGEDIKHLESGADSHLEKDFGKMYILR